MRLPAVLRSSTAVLATVAGAWWGTAIRPAAHQLSIAGSPSPAAAVAASEIATLNTFSARDAGTDVRHWLDATSGPLHEDIAASAASTADRIAADGISATGTVTDLAFVSASRVIATVRVDVVPRSGAAATDRRRVAADVVRTPEGWRLTSLTAIPAGASQTQSGGVGPDPVLAHAAATVAELFSYGPDSPPSSVPDLSGSAADQYRAIAGSLAPQIRAQDLTLTTRVVAAGFTSRAADTARVLAFIDQTSTRHGGSPTVAAGALALTLRLTAGRWQIVSLNAE